MKPNNRRHGGDGVNILPFVMAGLVPAIHVLLFCFLSTLLTRRKAGRMRPVNRNFTRLAVLSPV
jgi:hypothetical protein